MAKTDGDLRIYRTCKLCMGFGEDFSRSYKKPVSCAHCDGEGRILMDVVSETRAKREAYQTRDAGYANGGRQPFD